jgi:hypothetical protein
MFVVLEHDTTDAESVPAAQRGRHWDLILEAPGRELLPTWQLAENPLQAAGEIPAQRIADHRRRYLDYQGEIRGGRGSVGRLERGLATIERLEGDELIAVLEGRHLRGRFEITRGRAGQIVFRPAGPGGLERGSG